MSIWLVIQETIISCVYFFSMFTFFCKYNSGTNTILAYNYAIDYSFTHKEKKKSKNYKLKQRTRKNVQKYRLKIFYKI